MLSDPVQRERYDDARAEGWLDDSRGRPSRTTAPAHHGAAGRAPGADDAASAPGRPAPEPTVVLPEGHAARRAARARARAAHRLRILFVIYILALSLVLPALLKTQYPTQTDRIDAINKQVDKLDRAEEQRPTTTRPTTKLSKQQRRRSAKAKSKTASTSRSRRRTTRSTEIAKDFQSFALLMYGVLLAVFLRHPRPVDRDHRPDAREAACGSVGVVRVDGSNGRLGRRVRTASSIPLAIALLLPQLGAIIGLGMVLWFLRDQNRRASTTSSPGRSSSTPEPLAPATSTVPACALRYDFPTVNL